VVSVIDLQNLHDITHNRDILCRLSHATAEQTTSGGLLIEEELAISPLFITDHSLGFTAPAYFNHNMATTIQRTSTLPSGKAAVLAKNDNDVVIVAAVRSAMTKVTSRALSSRFPG
jgi:hypothetical protein